MAGSRPAIPAAAEAQQRTPLDEPGPRGLPVLPCRLVASNPWPSQPRCCPTASSNGSRPRGWSPREHQLALLQKARDDRSALLIAPTGAGKTLAGFLPTLVELSSAPAVHSEIRRFHRPRRQAARGGLHTLYISPLKALAVDIARNLETADRRDGAADQGRDPHRRHAGVARAAAAALSARTSC